VFKSQKLKRKRRRRRKWLRNAVLKVQERDVGLTIARKGNSPDSVGCWQKCFLHIFGVKNGKGGKGG